MGSPLRVMVTAGASGIGAAIASRFAAEGALVSVLDADPVAVEAVSGMHAVAGDCSSADVVDAWFDDRLAAWGGIDVLVNNAGIAGPTAYVEDVSPDAWRETLAVGIDSHFLTSRRAAAVMKAQGSGSIVAISSTAPVAELRRLMRETKYSRVPVYRQSLDDIVGVASVRDVLEFEGDPAESIEGLTRQVFLVPETKKIAVLLRELQAQRSTFAVAIDEYGGTAGIVSVEDIVEELVGEIKDEYDVESEPISVDERGAVVVAGRVNLDRLEQALEVSLEADAEVGTVGGFVTAIFGHIPKVGEVTEHEGFRVEVLDAERKRVNRVRFTRVPVEVDRT